MRNSIADSFLFTFSIKACQKVRTFGTARNSPTAFEPQGSNSFDGGHARQLRFFISYIILIPQHRCKLLLYQFQHYLEESESSEYRL